MTWKYKKESRYLHIPLRKRQLTAQDAPLQSLILLIASRVHNDKTYTSNSSQ